MADDLKEPTTDGDGPVGGPSNGEEAVPNASATTVEPTTLRSSPSRCEGGMSWADVLDEEGDDFFIAPDPRVAEGRGDSGGGDFVGNSGGGGLAYLRGGESLMGSAPLRNQQRLRGGEGVYGSGGEKMSRYGSGGGVSGRGRDGRYAMFVEGRAN
eukprot:GHVS01076563.1.p1 GENE.GHVS01076563.1~~GHVS01076563.1.p1  ORF type:complete len:155 (+),score=52.90 GHVS01076563.1:26-490(+)